MCSANDGVEDVTHFLLSCQLYGHIRIELLNSVSRITGTNANDLDKQALVKLLLFGNEHKYSFVINKRRLLSTMTFITNYPLYFSIPIAFDSLVTVVLPALRIGSVVSLLVVTPSALTLVLFVLSGGILAEYWRNITLHTNQQGSGLRCCILVFCTLPNNSVASKKRSIFGPKITKNGPNRQNDNFPK